jgi:hypothetical protein
MLFHELEGIQSFADGETEFGTITAGGLPAAGAAAGELDAQAHFGPHADLLAVFENEVEFGELSVMAEAAEIVSVLTFLRDDAECGFACFIDICGVDYPQREKRFDVVSHLLAPYKNRRIRVKVETDEDTPVPSAISVFRITKHPRQIPETTKKPVQHHPAALLAKKYRPPHPNSTAPTNKKAGRSPLSKFTLSAQPNQA